MNAPTPYVKGSANHTVWKVSNQQTEKQKDLLAIEAPLEINIAYGPSKRRVQKPLSITMRTPGQDLELALGFLFTEGIIQSPDQVQEMKQLDVFLPELERNRVLISLRPEVAVDMERLERHFYTTSSCGVCGKSSIDAIKVGGAPQQLATELKADTALIHKLPSRLRQEQAVFDCTGGLHASALFSIEGELLLLREDVGRHNALDKLIGASLRQGLVPLSQHILLLSGRISFELVQKALLAEAPIVVAVGAPSSLAVELAQETGMTLIGFVRDERFNIYTHPERVIN